MKETRISVILPIKGSPPTLKDCIKSIISQDHSNLEIIVITDSDQLHHQLQKWMGSREHKILVEEGNGVYAAMNLGLQNSSGDWLYFIGADDQIVGPEIFSRMLNHAAQCQIIYGNVTYIDRVSSKIPKVHRGKFGNSLYFRNTLHHQGTLYAKDCFSDLQFDEGLKILADYKVNLSLLRKGYKACFVDENIADCGAGGLSKQFNKHLYSEEISIKKQLLPGWAYLVNIPWVWIKYLYKRN